MLTMEQRQQITDTLARMHLPSGLGTPENACSIAAINLALTGKLTDSIPACMSEVVGNCIIVMQDSMPDALRNSTRWKSLLPLAAGTGRSHEPERLQILMDHMWTVALPIVQPLADAHGFGGAWREMIVERSAELAWSAAWSARSAARSAAWSAASAESAESAARSAAWSAESAERSAAESAESAASAAESAAEIAAASAAESAARSAAWSAESAARSAAWSAASAASAESAESAAWDILDPCGLLERLIAVGEAQ